MGGGPVIFVTIGTVFPFDRMIAAMDAFAATRDDAVIAQIGDGAYEPAHMTWHRSLPGELYARTVADADVIVSHAGMGSAITALQTGTPLVMVPRRFETGEHTTDHQMATARWLESKPGIFIAWNEADLAQTIAEAEAWGTDGAPLDANAPAGFTDRLGAQLRQWTSG